MPYKDKNKQKAYNRAYRLANKEKLKRYIKAYSLSNKEAKKIYDKNYRLANKEKVKAYRLANSKKIKAVRKIYRQNNREKIAINNRKRRALKFGAHHKSYNSNYVFERDGWICGICGQKINKRLKWPHPRSKSIDHIIPLSKGGNDNLLNVQAAHVRCNVGKHAQIKGSLKITG